MQLALFPDVVRPQFDYPCGWCGTDGSQCGLEMGHKGLHEFTIEPPEEYWEEG